MKNKLVLSLSNTIGIRIFINEYLDVDYVDDDRITHHSMIKYLIEKGYKLPTRVSFDSVKEIDIETGKYLAVMEETKKKKKGKILIYENPKRLNMNKLLEELKSNTSSDQLRKTREKILNETFGLTNDDSLGVIPIEEKTSQEKEDDYQVTSSVNRQMVYMLTTRNHIVRKRRY